MNALTRQRWSQQMNGPSRIPLDVPRSTVAAVLGIARYLPDAAIVIATLLLISACAVPDRVTKTHLGPRPDDAPFDKLLVVDLSRSPIQRQEAEDRLTALLAVAPRIATPSHHILGLDSPIEGSQIADAANKMGAQVVLVTRVESIRADVAKLEDRADVKVSCRRGEPYDLFLYDYEELPIPDEIIVKQQIILTANLYRADEGTHLWGIQSECFDQATVNEALSRHARNIVTELTRARLIR
jgi:hypothetical protein